MKTIIWSKLSNEEKDAAVAEAYGVKAIKWLLDCFNGPFEYTTKEEAIDAQHLLDGDVKPIHTPYSTSVDACLVLAMEKDLTIEIDNISSPNNRKWRVHIYGEYAYHVNPAEALCIALLRYSGLAVEV